MKNKVLAKMAISQSAVSSWVSHAVLVGVSAALAWIVQNQTEIPLGAAEAPILVWVISMILSYINKVIQNPVAPDNDQGNFPIQ